MRKEAQSKIDERDKEIIRLRGIIVKIMALANIEAVNLSDSKLTLTINPNIASGLNKGFEYKAPIISNNSEGGKLSGAWLRMLQAVKMFHPVPVSVEKISFWSDTGINKSTFKNGLSFLKSKGYIQKSDGNVVLTDEGDRAAGNVEAMPKDFNRMVEIWLNRLGPSWAEMFKVVLGAYPSDVHESSISELSGIERNKSTFKNGMSRLRTLNLIYETVKGRYRVCEEFMN
ncbi:MAG: hypothetical protein HOP31_01065 [Ignavibacteria bacterium]|nr:hypothetical protein [Ignavibacteria bacterium]